MKLHGLALLILCSFFFVACDSDELEEDTPPVICKGIDCSVRMKWKIVTADPNFPQNFQLLLNGDEQINNCLPGSAPFRVTRGNQVVNLEIDDFHAIGPDEKFTLTIRNLGSCYENKAYYEKAEQPYKFKKVDGEEVVWIEL